MAQDKKSNSLDAMFDEDKSDLDLEKGTGKSENTEKSVGSGELDSFFDDLSAMDETILPAQGQEMKMEQMMKAKKSPSFLFNLSFKKLFSFLPRFKKQPSLTNKKGFLSWRWLVLVGILILGGGSLFWWGGGFFQGLKNLSFYKEIPSYFSHLFSGPNIPKIRAPAPENKISLQEKDPEYFSKNGSWFIQVASCLNEGCKKKTQTLLDQQRIPSLNVQTLTSRSASMFIKIYLADAYEYLIDAKTTQDKLNFNNTFGLQAYIEKKENVYQVVLGVFPQETYGIDTVLKSIKQEVQKILPNSLFVENYFKKWDQVEVYFVGPFSTKEQGQNYLDKMQNGSGFKQAFLTVKQE